MKMVAEELLYTKRHEWVRAEGIRAYIGITDFGQERLGALDYIEPEAIGKILVKGEGLATLEGQNKNMELRAPASGCITDINLDVSDEPALCNDEPYDSWIVELELDDPSELDRLMEPDAYEDYCQSLMMKSARD